MEDTCTKVSDDVVDAANQPPKRKRGRPPKGTGKKSSAFSRHKSGSNQKNSKTHQHLSVQEVTATAVLHQATQAPRNDTRVADLKRTTRRMAARLSNAAAERDEYAIENKQLKKKLKISQKSIKLIEQTAEERVDKAVQQMERDVELREAAMERDIELREKAAEKMTERATKRMENAANVSVRADGREKKAAARSAAAEAAMVEAVQKQRSAAKEKATATKERKGNNANALAKANASARKISTLEDKVSNLEEKVKRLQSELSITKKELATALKDAATIKDAQEVLVEDYEKKIQSMLEMVEGQKEAGRIVVKKESVKGSGFKRWSNNMVQLIMEYLVSKCR